MEIRWRQTFLSILIIMMADIMCFAKPLQTETTMLDSANYKPNNRYVRNADQTGEKEFNEDGATFDEEVDDDEQEDEDPNFTGENTKSNENSEVGNNTSGDKRRVDLPEITQTMEINSSSSNGMVPPHILETANNTSVTDVETSSSVPITDNSTKHTPILTKAFHDQLDNTSTIREYEEYEDESSNENETNSDVYDYYDTRELSPVDVKQGNSETSRVASSQPEVSNGYYDNVTSEETTQPVDVKPPIPSEKGNSETNYVVSSQPEVSSEYTTNADPKNREFSESTNSTSSISDQETNLRTTPSQNKANTARPNNTVIANRSSIVAAKLNLSLILFFFVSFYVI